MVKVGKWIARHRILMLLIGVLLIIPSVIGIAKTKVNYGCILHGRSREYGYEGCTEAGKRI